MFDGSHLIPWKPWGEVKETAGKVTENKELELKGKLQSLKSDINKKFE